MLLIPLILVKFTSWQDMFSPYLESFAPAFCAEASEAEGVNYRDVNHSFTPVLVGLCFLLRIETNSIAHLLLIPLILAEFSYWQEFYHSKFE